MSDDRSQLERFRDAHTAAGATILLLTLLGVSIALLVMGNTLGRAIGIVILALSLFVATRAVRERRS
jgi:hypothetical protein